MSGKVGLPKVYMALNEHITAEVFERYRRKISMSDETLDVLRHIGVCAACREQAARISMPEAALAAMQNTFSFNDYADEPEHLEYRQLEFFLDDKLDEIDREIAESHLAFCGECAKDLDDLRTYREIADTPIVQKQAAVETLRKSFWSKIFAVGSIGSFAPVAAVLLIAAVFGAWLMLRGTQNNEIAQIDNQNAPAINDASNNANANPLTNSFGINNAPVVAPSPDAAPSPAEILPNNETLYALNDGQVTIDEQGAIKGLENLSAATRDAIKQSLQTGKVPVSNAANELGGGGGVLMSGSDADSGVPFGLQTPLGKIIRENQPVLRWKPLKDATAYSVAIVDEKFRVVAESGKLNATTWKPSNALPRGANYSWQVTATLPDGTETVSPSSPAPQARFRIVEQNLYDDIKRFERSGSRSHLALGTLYAKAGLKREARAEFEKLARENPKSEIARKLLQSVK